MCAVLFLLKFALLDFVKFVYNFYYSAPHRKASFASILYAMGGISICLSVCLSVCHTQYCVKTRRGRRMWSSLLVAQCL